MLVGAAATFGGLIVRPLDAFASPDEEITHTSAAIHHTRAFSASPKRVYAALTDARQFHQVTMLSEAMKGGMPPGGLPTAISPEPGGTFTLFGGQITGRHIELVPAKRIVQAWREADWNPGVFSLVTFTLDPRGSGTTLVFTHTGFPDANASHLSAGWKANYWVPLARFLT